jgi:hypothetical protein
MNGGRIERPQQVKAPRERQQQPSHRHSEAGWQIKGVIAWWRRTRLSDMNCLHVGLAESNPETRD